MRQVPVTGAEPRQVAVEHLAERWATVARRQGIVAPGPPGRLDGEPVRRTGRNGTVATSVHVYSPPIRSMTYYERSPRGRLVPVRREPVLDVALLDVA